MNLFELFVKIGVDDQASGNLKSISQKLGNGLKTAAKIGTAAVSAAAAGITALTTAAVNNYAEYEQLVGGVDTLFKDASQKVQQYAADAYKTAGMSANDYMANATAFSASLISALGDDTEAAAEYANRAMVSMSDNANKMGTNIDSIVQTYQSLARGNFAMLDNLKLGYGGTKAELERLIADAASYTEIQKEMGITVDASSTSFDNIVNAIAVVQGKLGIAGATAQEAGTTIEGSVNSMKSAWQNLITGLADGNADIGQLVDNLVTTIVGDGTESNLGVLGNIMPTVKTALTGASNLVGELLPKIVQEIPSIINDNLPILAEAAISIIQSLVDGISQNQEMLMTTALDTIVFLANSLVSMLPKIVQLGLDLIVSLANGISQNLGTLIPTIIDVVLQIVDTLTNPNTLLNLIDACIAIILALADGLIDALPGLIAAVPVIIENLVQAIIEAVPMLLKAAYGIINSLYSALLNPENIALLVVAGMDILFALIEGIGSLLFEIPGLALEIIEMFASGLSGNLGIANESGSELLQSIADGFMENIDEAAEWGKDLIDNFVEGIKAKWEKLKNTVIEVAETVKDFLGFSEPEKGPLSNFHTYAPDMMELFAKGIRDNENIITDQIEKSFDFGEKIVSAKVSYKKQTQSLNGNDRIVDLLSALLDAVLSGNAEMVQAVMADKSFSVSGREFGRLVREYA